MVKSWKVSEVRLAAALAYYDVTPTQLKNLTGWSYAKSYDLMKGKRSMEPFKSDEYSLVELIGLAENIRDAPEVII